jgi:hypothetical protein
MNDWEKFVRDNEKFFEYVWVKVAKSVKDVRTHLNVRIDLEDAKTTLPTEEDFDDHVEQIMRIKMSAILPEFAKYMVLLEKEMHTFMSWTNFFHEQKMLLFPHLQGTAKPCSVDFARKLFKDTYYSLDDLAEHFGSRYEDTPIDLTEEPDLLAPIYWGRRMPDSPPNDSQPTDYELSEEEEEEEEEDTNTTGLPKTILRSSSIFASTPVGAFGSENTTVSPLTTFCATPMGAKHVRSTSESGLGSEEDVKNAAPKIASGIPSTSSSSVAEAKNGGASKKAKK